MVGWVMASLVPAISFLRTLRDGNGIAGTTPGDDGLKRLLLLLLKIRLDRSAQLDRQRIAMAVLGLADFDANPTLADAIFADIGLLGAPEAYADIALERFGVVERTSRIVRHTVGWSLDFWRRFFRHAANPSVRYWHPCRASPWRRHRRPSILRPDP